VIRQFILFACILVSIIARGVCLEGNLHALAGAWGVVTLICAVTLGYLFFAED